MGLAQVRSPAAPLLLVLALALVAAACGESEPDPTPTLPAPAAAQPELGAAPAVALPDKIVAPHFVNSYPAHGDVLAQAPEVVLLNFNFNLKYKSAINVTRDGEAVSAGPAEIAESEISMQAPLTGESADGVYKVDYDACWPDGSCHEGSVAFTVDSTKAAEYQDLRGEAQVTINMTDDLVFDPARIVISPRTTVTWVNTGSNIHFVNTDPHPSHNVLEDLNSTSLRQGQRFTFTFDTPGAWGYHCSAHFNLGMTAQVIVK